MSTKKLLFWVTCYSIAMGFLESAVVIYLRASLYPDGFAFPLVPMHRNLAAVEIWREAGTLVMLLAIGMIAGKNRGERLAWFIFSFAVWDICYYVFLYLFLDWPQTLLTWDILFLIPVPWVGPVIAPVIIATTMILFALSIIHYSGKKVDVALKPAERLLLLLGALICIAAFTEDYIVQNRSILYSNAGNGRSFLSEMQHYVPKHFDWISFSVGELLLILCYAVYVWRRRKLVPAEG